MSELVLLQNYRSDRPATFDEYRRSGGYQALAEAIKRGSSARVRQMVADSDLRGRGGAGFTTAQKWNAVHDRSPFPRYILPNSDEMEPGTFKDRVLVNADPHMVIEGILLTGYAVFAQEAVFFIRPSYELDAALIERELEIARREGFLGKNILGSDFSFEIVVHRSGGRYICGEATAQVSSVEGKRPNPNKTVRMAERGLWGKPTIVNNVETLACVPHILRRGSAWFKSLARTKTGAGTKLYCVSGKVRRPGCYELPMGTPLSDIIEREAGGMLPGSELKAFLPGGASTAFLPVEFFHIEMDFDSFREVGHRLGTGAVVVFDHKTCLVGATLNLLEYFSRESCGFCTPCREGLPFLKDILRRLENGEGKEAHIPMLRDMAKFMDFSYCAFAPGAASPVVGLLTYFEEEVREHISQHQCPFKRKTEGTRMKTYGQGE